MNKEKKLTMTLKAGKPCLNVTSALLYNDKKNNGILNITIYSNL